jgi:general secretion pathway protein E/type IV pilus assembly protein PilB
MKDFEKFLLEKNIIQPSHLEQLAESAAENAEPIYYRLLRSYPELEGTIWLALSQFLQVELVGLHQFKQDPELARLVPPRLAHEYSVVPVSRQGNTLLMAMADPRQFAKCDEFAMVLAQHVDPKGGMAEPLTVVPRLAMPSHVRQMIKLVYGIGAETVQDMLDSQGDTVTFLGPNVVDLTGAQEVGEEAAIIRFVNQLLLEAAKLGASDIHIEPYEKDLRVRYRVDGMLRDEPVPDKIKHLEAAIVSRIKIMARMDIAEKRLPQDGQIRLSVLGRPIDVRVSLLPTIYGQGLALRLLDRQIAFRQLDNLGMPDDYLSLYRKVLHLSHGVVLVTGPTGSGKTTTLYASLNEINRADRKVITVEDPVEYQLEGIAQIQVKPGIGLSFANLLRNILRHDPDIIMVGEIRDPETARIAVSAAMTGHLVFSTLHTNDAPSAPVRLLEMGLEPYLVSSSLEAVIAQRLVRILCPVCREKVNVAHALSPEERKYLKGQTVYRSKGCRECLHGGYLGRTAIFEMFTVDDAVRQLIITHADASMIRQEAMRKGMRTLLQSGFEKVGFGYTSLEEVYRVAREEAIDMREYMK